MIVGSPNRLTNRNLLLSLEGIGLDRVDFYEYVGVFLDAPLNMEKAVNSLYSKTSHKLHLFGLMRNYSSKKAAIRFLKAMAIPYLDYFVCFFSSCSDRFSDSRIEDFECLNVPSRTSYITIT